jgi:hypothetical protein
MLSLNSEFMYLDCVEDDKGRNTDYFHLHLLGSEGIYSENEVVYCSIRSWILDLFSFKFGSDI